MRPQAARFSLPASAASEGYRCSHPLGLQASPCWDPGTGRKACPLHEGKWSLQYLQCSLGKRVLIVAVLLLASKHVLITSEWACMRPVNFSASKSALVFMLPAGMLGEATTGTMVGMKLEAMTEAMTEVMTEEITGAAEHHSRSQCPHRGLHFGQSQAA